MISENSILLKNQSAAFYKNTIDQMPSSFVAINSHLPQSMSSSPSSTSSSPIMMNLVAHKPTIFKPTASYPNYSHTTTSILPSDLIQSHSSIIDHENRINNGFQLLSEQNNEYLIQQHQFRQNLKNQIYAYHDEENKNISNESENDNVDIANCNDNKYRHYSTSSSHQHHRTSSKTRNQSYTNSSSYVLNNYYKIQQQQQQHSPIIVLPSIPNSTQIRANLSISPARPSNTTQPFYSSLMTPSSSIYNIPVPYMMSLYQSNLQPYLQ